MRLIHKKDLKYQKKIGLSFWSPIIGTVLIGSWGYGIFNFMLGSKMPVFIIGTNIFFFFIFVAILFKQYLQFSMPSERFLMAFNGSEFIFPLNHAIKSPEKNLNYYLGVGHSSDINNVSIIKEKASIPLKSHQNKISYTSQYFLHIELKESPEENIVEKHEEIIVSEGFSGSPLIIDKNHLYYLLNCGNIKSVISELRKTGISDFKVKTKEFSINSETSKEEILFQVNKIRTLKTDIFLSEFISYLTENKLIESENLPSSRPHRP